MINLTEGAILTMLNPERQQSKDSGFKPVLQVTDIRSVTQTSSDWYLMNLSDGAHMHHGMLATERNELVRSQRLQKGSIIQVSLFVSTVIRNHRIIEIIDLEPLLEKCDPIGDPKPLVLKGDASSRVNAKRSNRPNSVVSKEKLAEFAEKEASLQHADKVEKKAKKEASLQHTDKVEKKDREAAQQKLIDEQEANKQLHEELAFIKAHDPASHLASPPTFIKTSPTGVITESENFVESKVLVAEEPKKKKIKIKFKVRSPCYSMEMDQEQQSQAVKKCLHCEITNTPQWRAGPLGPKTLCNACGVRFKAGRLFPEYRPAASPTFVPTVHSNSHRKVLQMRGTVNGKDSVVGTAAKTYAPSQRAPVPVPAPFPVPDM